MSETYRDEALSLYDQNHITGEKKCRSVLIAEDGPDCIQADSQAQPRN